MQAYTKSNLDGIDISKWQSTPNFAALKAGGYEFCYVRVGDGTTADPKFAEFWKGCRSNRIHYGAYHYTRPTSTSSTEPKTQANFFVDTMLAGGMENFGIMMPVLDIESNSYGLSGDQLANWLLTYVDVVNKRTERQVMIYSSCDFIANLGGHFNYRLSHLPLWVAAYDTYGYDNTTKWPEDVGGWTKWTVWQYKIGRPASEIQDIDMNKGPSTLEPLLGHFYPRNIGKYNFDAFSTF